MPRRTRCSFLTVVALAATAAVPVSAPAQLAGRTATADSLPLSLAEAVARGLRQSEEVRLARSNVELAGAQVVAARSAARAQSAASAA